jgi:hypothetical protein
MSVITAEMKSETVEFRLRGQETLVIFDSDPAGTRPASYYSTDTGFHAAALSRAEAASLTGCSYYLVERALKSLSAFQTLGDQVPDNDDLYDEDLENLAVKHAGIKVYHTERGAGSGDITDNWYSVQGFVDWDESSDVFDVRDFFVPDEIDRDDDIAVLRYAIDSGQLTDDGVDEDRINELESASDEDEDEDEDAADEKVTP